MKVKSSYFSYKEMRNLATTVLLSWKKLWSVEWENLTVIEMEMKVKYLTFHTKKKKRETHDHSSFMEKALECGMREFEYDRNENESELITLKCGKDELRACLVIVFKNRFMFFKNVRDKYMQVYNKTI